MVKIILTKSPDEWATTKQVCSDELVVYLSFSSHNMYTYRLVILPKTPKSVAHSNKFFIGLD